MDYLLQVMRRAIFFFVLLISLPGWATSWPDTDQRRDTTQIYQEFRQLALLVSTPEASVLKHFGMLTWQVALVPGANRVEAGSTELGFHLQPLPEWIFSVNLWHFPGKNRTYSVGLSANYIWKSDAHHQWSSALQTQQVMGPGNFSQHDLSLVQHYHYWRPKWSFGAQLAYIMERSLFEPVLSLQNQKHGFWAIGVGFSKTLFKSMAGTISLKLGKTGVLGTLGVKWGFGE